MTTKRYSRDYDTVYFPAMPVVDLVLINPTTGEESSRFTAIIDSGADNSLIPLSILRPLELDGARKVRMVGVGGISQIMDHYLVGAKIGDIPIWGIRVLANKTNREAVIGRDVLNQLIIELNGLAQVTEISA